MFVDRQAVALTTDTDGVAEGFTAVTQGDVVQIRYVPHASTPLDTGATVTITEEETGLPIVTKASIGTSAFSLAPRQPTHGVADGAALLYAPAGAAVGAPVAVKGRIKVAISGGGNTLSGTFYIWIAG